MFRFRMVFFILLIMAAILIFRGRLYNYSLCYFNWTYLSNPITNQTIYAFSNTSDCPQELTAIQNAAATWNSSGAAFAFPQIQEGPTGGPAGGFHWNVNDGQNQIGWLYPWPGAYNGQIAHTSIRWQRSTGRILEVDTAFDDGQVWSTESEPAPGTYDVQSVMLHEFGHWLGLGHSADKQVDKPIVMNPSYAHSGPPAIRELSQDDKDGAKAIYNYIGWAGRRITSNTGESVEPVIAITQDNDNTTVAEDNCVHLAWSDNSTGHYKIYYKRHILGGNENVAWTATIGLNSPSGDSGVPDIATAYDQDNILNVHVVWCENSPGNNEIYYARSVNGGTSFCSPVRLTQNQGDSIAPAIAADDNGGVYVVWMDNNPGIAIGNPANYEIFFIRSSDWGNTWSDMTQLTDHSEYSGYTAFSGYPDIALDSDNLNRYVVWRDNRNYLIGGGVPEIYFKAFVGANWDWGTEKRLTTSGGGGCYQPAIAVTKNDHNIHVVYLYEVPENFNGDIFCLKSTNYGSSFTSERISTTYAYSSNPQISLGYIDEGAGQEAEAAKQSPVLHVVWQEDSAGGEEIYYAWRRLWEGPWTWSSPIRISDNGTHCYGVSVSAFGYNIDIAWAQKVGTESDQEIHQLRNRARVE